MVASGIGITVLPWLMAQPPAVRAGGQGTRDDGLLSYMCLSRRLRADPPGGAGLAAQLHPTSQPYDALRDSILASELPGVIKLPESFPGKS